MKKVTVALSFLFILVLAGVLFFLSDDTEGNPPLMQTRPERRHFAAGGVYSISELIIPGFSYDGSMIEKREGSKHQSSKLAELIVPKENADPLILSARAFLAMYQDEKDASYLLGAQEHQRELPIASITKLMTAVVAIKNLDTTREVTITKQALAHDGTGRKFIAGTTFTVKNLLHALLIESDNDAAHALAQAINQDYFVGLMNQQALLWGMKHTRFINPTGLDEKTPSGDPRWNYATADDLFMLASHILKEYPDIFAITSLAVYDLYDASGARHRTLTNTNKLLASDVIRQKIIGGKTGETAEAKQNLLLVTKSTSGQGHFIFIILGSNHRFEDMEQLARWVEDNYTIAAARR